MTANQVRAKAHELTGLDTSRCVIRFPKSAPQIVEELFPSRPVSLIDLTYYSAKGSLPDKRVVPVDRDYGLFPRCSSLRLIAPEELYAQLAPRAHYRFPFEVAASIKRAYWDGDRGMQQLARDHDVPVKDVYRLVHSLTYWYLT